MAVSRVMVTGVCGHCGCVFLNVRGLAMVVGVHGEWLCVFRGHAAYASGVELLHNKTEVGGR